MSGAPFLVFEGVHKAFGDKHSLFLATFERYLDRMFEGFEALFAQMPPADALRAWVTGAQEFGRDCPLRRGCMALNSVVELAQHDSEVKAMLHSHYRRVELLITKALAAGQREGVLRNDVTALKLARFLMVWAAGAATTSQAEFAGLDRENMAELVYSVLE